MRTRLLLITGPVGIGLVVGASALADEDAINTTNPTAEHRIGALGPLLQT